METVPPGGAIEAVQRPDPREFLRSVLEGLEDLPDGFTEELESLAELPPDERADAIQKLIEEFAG